MAERANEGEKANVAYLRVDLRKLHFMLLSKRICLAPEMFFGVVKCGPQSVGFRRFALQLYT